MPSAPPDIKKLKADKNELELIAALEYDDDPNIPEEAAQALACIGTIQALEPLCRIMEDSQQATQARVITATAVGDISARFLRLQGRIDTDSLSDDELHKHREQDLILSRAGSRLKLSMKAGPADLRKAAGSAYMILPLEDDSDIMKAFSNGTTVSFHTASPVTDVFAQSSEEPDTSAPESPEDIQSIAGKPDDEGEDTSEESDVQPEPEVEIPVQPETEDTETPVEPDTKPETEDAETPVEPDTKPETENAETPVEPDTKPETEDAETPAEPDAKPETEDAETPVEPDTKPETEDADTGKLNLDEIVEIAPDTYWIGIREGSLLERNIYLRIFSDGEKTINLLIDPGAPADLTPLIEKLSAKIGGLSNLHLMYLNHQDPDVAYNAEHLQKLNPDCIVLCSEDSWRLVKLYGLDPKKYRAIEQFNDLTAELSTGHRLRFVPSPFCHFRGAVMLYDEETGILFSGDLFGGISFVPDLFATEDSWDGISVFHQIYMPCLAAIRNASGNIRKLDTLPVMIAPQHGGIISGDLVNNFLARMDKLEVGVDLFLKEHTKANYIEVMNDLLSEFRIIAGPKIVTEVLHAFLADSSFPNVISLGANGIHDIKINPYDAIRILLCELQSKTPPETWNEAEKSILKILTMRKISIPDCMILTASDDMVFNLGDRFMSGVSDNAE